MLSQGSASSTLLSLKHVFGLNTSITRNIHFLEEKKIIYPVGHYIVKYNFSEKIQQYIAGNENFRGITAMAISFKNQLMAIAERGERPNIYVYDITHLRKKKFCVIPDDVKENFEEYVDMTFLPEDETRLLGLTGLPDVTILYWALDKTRLLATFRVVQGMACISLGMFINDRNFSVVGNKVFKLFTLAEDNSIKLISSEIINGDPQDAKSYTCQTHLKDGNCVIGTLVGKIYLVDSKGHYLNTVFDGGVIYPIECMCTTKSGFLAGSDNSTIFRFAIKPDENNEYEKLPEIQLLLKHSNEIGSLSGHKIKYISAEPILEEQAVCTTHTNQIINFSIATSGENDIEEKDSAYEILTSPGHYGQLRGMDICIRKPLIVTCSTDQTIRVWNYETRQLETVLNFTEEPLSLSFHPSGLHLGVVFPDKVKIMNLFVENKEQRRDFREINLKGGYLINFSHGGHMFAVAVASNPQIIYIYYTYTGENPSHLICKAHTGKITSLEWTKDDFYLLSAGKDGFFYQWKIADGSRVDLIPRAGVFFLSIGVTNDISEHRCYYVTTEDKNVRAIIDQNQEIPILVGAVYGSIALTQKNNLYFLGVCDEEKKSMAGLIRVYRHPLSSNIADQIQAHDYNGVFRLCVTLDDHYLISAGVDGSICIFEIKDKEVRLGKKEGFLNPSNEVMITKSEIDELKDKKKMLINNLKDLQNQNIAVIHSGIDEEIKGLKEQLSISTKNEEENYVEMKEKTKEMKSKFDETLKNIRQKHEEIVRGQEINFNNELKAETSRYDSLKIDHEKMEEKYKDELYKLKQVHLETLRKIDDFYQSQLLEEEQQIQRYQSEKQTLSERHEEILKQIEEETKTEMDHLQTQFLKEITELRDQTIKIKNNAQTIKKKNESHDIAIGQITDTLKERQATKEQLEAQLAKLTEEIKELSETMQAKNAEISLREKKIYQLKKKTQELEKHKFVLDYKIKELKKDIAPRDQTRKDLKHDTNEMDKELKILNTVNTSLGKFVASLTLEEKNMIEKIANQREEINLQKSKIRNLENSIHDAVQSILNFDVLREKLLNMKIEEKKEVEVNQNIFSEYESQLKYLEKSVNMLKKNLELDSDMHKDDNTRIMTANVKLIKEINDLRTQVKDLKIPTEKNKASSSLPPTKMRQKIKDFSKEEDKRLSDIKETENQAIDLKHSMEKNKGISSLPSTKMRQKIKELSKREDQRLAEIKDTEKKIAEQNEKTDQIKKKIEELKNQLYSYDEVQLCGR